MSIKFEEYMIIPTTSVSINANGTYSVVDKASAIVNVQQYTEISTAEGMEAVKIDANHGNIYKYVGTSTSTYINGRFYIVQRSQTHTNTLSGVGNYPFVSSSVLTLDPNIYDGPYESSGTTDSNQSVARIDTTGYKSITIWINSFAESIYDYTILSDLNADTYPTSGSGDKSTSGFQHDPRNGLNVDNWKKITYELTENQNHFFIVYRKDGSASSNDDKGYFVLECHDSQNASFIEYMPIPTSSITINANGTYNIVDYGYASVNIPITPTQTKSMILGSSAPANVTPDSGYALSSVSPSIDTSVIKAENIKKDVQILGVTGTHEGTSGGYAIEQTINGDVCSLAIISDDVPVLQEKSVTLGSSVPENVMPDSGYDGMTKVNMALDSSVIKADNIASGVTILGVTGTHSGGGANYITQGQHAYSTMTSFSNSSATDVLDFAFERCSNLATVNLPSARYIGYCAFNGCGALTLASLPNVKYIGAAAFAGTNLRTLYLPELLTIERTAFSGCANLTEISFPKVITIGSSAFAGGIWTDMNISTAYIPNAEYIGTYAFSGCKSLASVNLPMALSIENNAFWVCASLSYVSAPLLSKIKNRTFYGTGIKECYFPSVLSMESETFCYAPISRIESTYFPALTYMSAYCFSECSQLEYANFPALTTIGACAFGGCIKLSTFSIPNISRIEYGGFIGCRSLNTIPLNNISFIGEAVFNGCSNLASVYIFASSVCTLSGTNAFQNTPIDGTYSSLIGGYGSIYVPASLLESYKTATNWSYYSNRLVGIE